MEMLDVPSTLSGAAVVAPELPRQRDLPHTYSSRSRRSRSAAMLDAR
jgi:hypothetical protein